MKIVVMGRQEARGNTSTSLSNQRQGARVKKLWAILLFFTHFGFIVFTYLKSRILIDINL
ncbi:MAG: hypothetical protein HEQ13_13880 [Dolichospermum sp. DEX189]|nr:hypothetical protein [Dolichospermum sp. DEX189]